jgi:capsular exopolysaccharide synthesis family protein
MEFKRLAALTRQWLWLLLVVSMVASLASYLVSQSITPTYLASVKLLISQPQNPGVADFNSIITAERLARTYGELLRTRPILVETIRQLDLPYTPEHFIQEKMIQVRVIRDTQLIELSVEHPNPELARDIANAIATAFIDQNRKDALNQTASYRESLEIQLADLDGQMKAASLRIEELRVGGDQMAESAYLLGIQAQHQAAYSQVLRTMQEIKLAEARTASTVRIAEAAEMPKRPVRPNVALNTILAGLAGLMLAAGIAFAAEYLDDSVKSSEDVERNTKLVTLGRIASFGKHRSTERPLIAQNHPQSAIVEAYRTLRTNLDFARISCPGTTLLVTSAAPGEGKTMTAANLAVVMAQMGRSVILVDADLRRPTLDRVFSLKNQVGLTNLLLRDTVNSEVVLAFTSPPDRQYPSLRVMTSGPIPPNPSELLASGRMAAIVEHLKGLADVVIFDSPPLLAVTDPLVLGSQLEGVLLVASAGQTKTKSLERAVEMLDHAAAPVLGVVLNRLSLRETSEYYSYSRHESKGKATQVGVTNPVVARAISPSERTIGTAAARMVSVETAGQDGIFTHLNGRGS